MFGLCHFLEKVKERDCGTGENIQGKKEEEKKFCVEDETSDDDGYQKCSLEVNFLPKIEIQKILVPNLAYHAEGDTESH
mgnify:CR=1 FL=1